MVRKFILLYFFCKCQTCDLQVCFLCFQEFGVRSNWTSLPLRWKHLERQWRCHVSYLVIAWRAMLLTGYDRSQGKLWSGLGGLTRIQTLRAMPVLFKAVLLLLKTCPAALSTSRSGAWQQKILLFTSVLVETQWPKTVEQLHKNLHRQQTCDLHDIWVLSPSAKALYIHIIFT